ncbi:acyltransferase [Iodobacter fluviatilis]|uniref:Acyltransferase n=1 Tax=Iodobacter fluviatilis TaxID=537 RepID=A0A7G3G739_9NEIS|nr:acyltransferase [Iodobacter fluviatilis]QBC43127.1 hypothetical protein C1H71_05895 [Iodobacter fluviatilis]
MIKVVGKGRVEIGKNCNIGEDAVVIFKNESLLSIGDYVTIGNGVKIIIENGNVTIGDWSTIHANTLLLSTAGLSIGRHCWFGQNSILDGTGGLSIDDGVRVGMYSQIWTHVAAGEQIEGCKLFSSRSTRIGRDVWLVGSCTVGSGIDIGERAICMNGSNITKSIPAHAVVAGIPARVREGVSFYKNISLSEKFSLMLGWVDEFCNLFNFTHHVVNDHSIIINGESELIIYLYELNFQDREENLSSVAFCIENKKYEKKFTETEEKFIRFLSGNKARFYPIQ